MSCIAFDLDGVLADCDELHRVALNEALVTCGPKAVLTMEEHLKVFKGLPTRVKLQRLVEAGRVCLECEEPVKALKQKKTLEALHRLQPDPAKVALLQTLRNFSWRMAVCSNAVRESVFWMLLQGGYIPYLEFWLSNEDAPPKPDPGMYTKAARIFGIPPSELVVIEDSAPGIASARGAGCRVIEVAGPHEVDLTLLPRILRVQVFAPCLL